MSDDRFFDQLDPELRDAVNASVETARALVFPSDPRVDFLWILRKPCAGRRGAWSARYPAFTGMFPTTDEVLALRPPEIRVKGSPGPAFAEELRKLKDLAARGGTLDRALRTLRLRPCR